MFDYHRCRTSHPYISREEMTKTIRRNTIRMAEVWMDDYKKFFYDRFDHELVSHSYYMNKRLEKLLVIHHFI